MADLLGNMFVFTIIFLAFGVVFAAAYFSRRNPTWLKVSLLFTAPALIISLAGFIITSYT